MRIAYCDCCKRRIFDREKIYSVDIKCGNSSEHILQDVCDDCYDRFKNIIDNAEKWRNQQV